MKALMTCFEDFSNVTENSSRLIVESLGLPHLILPVSFEDCDQNIPNDLDALIMVGVAASRDIITVERYAHNLMHSPIQPDNDGIKPSHKKIFENAPAALETNINCQELDSISGQWQWSLSAGSYVCNAAYFKALWNFKETKVIFIHVPHHLSATNPKQSLKLGQDFLLQVWSHITKDKKARHN